VNTSVEIQEKSYILKRRTSFERMNDTFLSLILSIIRYTL